MVETFKVLIVPCDGEASVKNIHTDTAMQEYQLLLQSEGFNVIDAGRFVIFADVNSEVDRDKNSCNTRANFLIQIAGLTNHIHGPAIVGGPTSKAWVDVDELLVMLVKTIAGTVGFDEEEI